VSIKAIVFDIGGVLELTPDLGVDTNWEQKLNLEAGELNKRLGEVWQGGSTGEISEAQVQQNIAEIMGWSEAQVNEYMEDIWREYLGTLNVELVEYFRSLRPKYQSAIISNSFVGAREKEIEHYHFDTICDFIIYSHEVGLLKPDALIFTLTCERLGLRPNEIIFVDDHDDLMTSARELGIHCIEFKDNAQTMAQIESLIQANI